jgi:hypothetical protein
MRKARLLLLTMLPAVWTAFAADAMVSGPVTAKSFSKLTFSPDGILFIADSIGARIWALDLEDRKPVAEPPNIEINDLEGKLGGMLGTDPRDVLIHDMAVNPISKNTYLTVSRGRRNFTVQWQLPNDVANASLLIRITPAGGMEEVRLDHVKRSFVDISNPIDEKVIAEFKTSKARVDAVSGMVFSNGQLIVAGLSNEEFSSNVRIFPFPFDGKGTETSVEIYHGSHGKFETNSPVRSFIPVETGGKRYLLASYLCTPLVLLPMDEMKNGHHLKGTTIAELGDGNYPLDMVAFRQKGKQRIMIVNSTRGIVVFDLDELAKPITPITREIEGTAGIPFEYLRNRGVLQAENWSGKDLLMLSRNPLNGEVSLWNMPVDRD